MDRRTDIKVQYLNKFHFKWVVKSSIRFQFGQIKEFLKRPNKTPNFKIIQVPWMDPKEISDEEVAKILVPLLIKMHEEIAEWFSPSLNHLESLANIFKGCEEIKVSYIRSIF